MMEMRFLWVNRFLCSFCYIQVHFKQICDCNRFNRAFSFLDSGTKCQRWFVALIFSGFVKVIFILKERVYESNSRILLEPRKYIRNAIENIESPFCVRCTCIWQQAHKIVLIHKELISNIFYKNVLLIYPKTKWNKILPWFRSLRIPVLRGKAKVKCSLVQTLRLCTGRTAHKGGRSIALFFLDHGTRRGWGVSVMPRPLFTPGKDPVPILQEAALTPGPVWTGEEISPPPRLDPQSLYRLQYPAHSFKRNTLYYSWLLNVFRSAAILLCTCHRAWGSQARVWLK